MEWFIGILIFLSILVASVFLVKKSVTDIPQQPDIVQQPALNKKQSNFLWKVIFIFFLLGNLILISYTTKALESGGFFAIGGFLGMVMVVGLIDIIAVVIYIYIRQPHNLHGSARFISYAVLIVAILALIFPIIIMAALFNLFR